MKRVGQLMQEMGFNKNAPDSVKEAFIKHLIRVSEGVNVTTPSERLEIESNPDRVRPLASAPKKAREPEQLSFDMDLTGTDDKFRK